MELFQSFASELISPRIQIIWWEEADRMAREFTAFITSAYRLSTRKFILSDISNDIAGLDLLLEYKQRLRKLWHEIRDPDCKISVNYATKIIRRMTRGREL
jgi:hypothetical protein